MLRIPITDHLLLLLLLRTLLWHPLDPLPAPHSHWIDPFGDTTFRATAGPTSGPPLSSRSDLPSLPSKSTLLRITPSLRYLLPVTAHPVPAHFRISEGCSSLAASLYEPAEAGPTSGPPPSSRSDLPLPPSKSTLFRITTSLRNLLPVTAHPVIAHFRISEGCSSLAPSPYEPPQFPSTDPHSGHPAPNPGPQ